MHIERTHAFREARSAGDISTLSFYIEDTTNEAHPVQVTRDGAVVLQSADKEKGAELQLVMYLKEKLLDGIYEPVPAKHSKKDSTYSTGQI